MNRADLTAELARRTGLPRARAAEIVAALFDPSTGVIAETLREGGTVALSDFGTFGVREASARQGRNPRTGKVIDIPARRACTFKPRKGLRSSMKDMVGA